jgi:hypothetical protein
MAELTALSRRQFTQDLSSHLNDLFGFKHVLSFRITRIEDIAPALSEVAVLVVYDFGSEQTEKVIRINVLYEDAAGRAIARAIPGGSWGVNDISALREKAYDPTVAPSQQ